VRQIGKMEVGGCRGEHLMIKAAQKATLFQSWDNPFDKRVQSQPNVWRIKVGTSLEGWSGDIVHWGPLQSLSARNTAAAPSVHHSRSSIALNEPLQSLPY